MISARNTCLVKTGFGSSSTDIVDNVEAPNLSFQGRGCRLAFDLRRLQQNRDRRKKDSPILLIFFQSSAFPNYQRYIIDILFICR